MKQFLGLLKFEHRQWSTFYGAICAVILLAIFALPHGVVYYYPHLEVKGVRFSVIMMSAVLILITTFVLFASSINRSKDNKDIWLHSSASIYMLVGAKVLYAWLGLIVMEACAFIGFFFVSDLIQGSFFDFVVFAFYCAALMLAIYAAFMAFSLVFYVFNLQMARYVKKFSFIIMFAAVVLFFKVLGSIPNITMFQYGKVDLRGLNNYLPTLEDTGYPITVFFSDFYIVEELIMWAILVGVYMVACKWLERVLTR